MELPIETETTSRRSDWLTTIAVAIVATSLASIVHEGLGHGGACLATGCRPQLVTTMQFLGNENGVSRAGVRFISAGGTLANVAAAAVALWLRRRRRDHAGPSWFFLWLFMTINLLQATGYLLYSGAADIGDWAEIVHGFAPASLWRTGLVIVGATTYLLAVRWSMAELGHRLSARGAARAAEANRYTLTAYVTGGILAITAGLFEPGGALLVLISGAAASLGGTSGLAWGPQLLRNAHFAAPGGPPLIVSRDQRWIVAGAVMALLFVFGLGPGVRLS